MKPSEKQLEGLQKYLKSVLSYQESYEEMYDHILSAIDTMPDEVSFEYAVNDIIKRDFGGHNNLEKVEKGIEAAIEANTRHLFSRQLKSLMTLQSLLFVTLIGILIYYGISIFKPNTIVLKGVVIASVAVPLLIALMRLFYLGYAGGKKGLGLHAVDTIIFKIAYLPSYISYCLILWLPFTFTWLKGIWTFDNALIITLFIIISLLYNVAFIKFYRAELKAVINLKE